MNVQQRNAYSELVEFLTSGPSSEDIVSFSASNETRKRVRYLMNAYNAGMLTSSERAELDEYHKIEEFLRQLKTRARRRTTQA